MVQRFVSVHYVDPWFKDLYLFTTLIQSSKDLYLFTTLIQSSKDLYVFTTLIQSSKDLYLFTFVSVHYADPEFKRFVSVHYADPEFKSKSEIFHNEKGGGQIYATLLIRLCDHVQLFYHGFETYPVTSMRLIRLQV